MKKRKLGALSVSAVGFGCMGLTHAYGAAIPKKEAIAQIRNAFEQGYTLFDTAEMYTGRYSDGTAVTNEEIVGEALSPIRNQVVTATKCGIYLNGDTMVLDSRPATIRSSVESSLKRMNMEVIDLYYLHRQDPSVEPETVAETMSELIKEGKIRYWGISNASEDYIRRADSVCKVSAVQDRYSMIARDSEALFKMLEERNIGFVAYSPLGNGFLTDAEKYSSEHYDKQLDFRSFLPQYTESGIKTGTEVIELIRRLAKEKETTTAQISLAWMLAKKPWIVPIPGTGKKQRMIENAGAADIIFTSDEVSDLDSHLNRLNLQLLNAR